MTVFQPRLEDYRFLWTLLDLDGLSALPGYDAATPDLVEQILVEAARFAVEILLPLNRDSDEIGASFRDGTVTTPPGFKKAYELFSAGGWSTLAGPADFGGQEMPGALNYALYEMMSAACISFVHYTALSHGAVLALEQHASPELKELYLEPLISGRWSGTMCLTESEAGSDLGLIRARAEPDGDGRYRVTGTKIFISSGEHDLTENIVHLVLARLPDAPAGVKGISLFVVPKYIPDKKGTAGKRNAVACGAIEHKMGLKGSATCVMHFDDAAGWLVGTAHRGLAAMFTMMNEERLLLSSLGQGIAEIAYQSAAAYARARLQGRAGPDRRAPGRDPVPIIAHPDVRRMLLTMRVHADSNRALGLWVMRALDISRRHPDPDERREAADFVALMTPIVKVWLSETGHEAAHLGIQVMGGHGFIREWGMEQLARDVRILQLYEGANGIHGLDLVVRKLPMNDGKLIARLTAPIENFLAEHEGNEALVGFVAPVREALDMLKSATRYVTALQKEETDDLGAAASDYLKIAGFAAVAYLWGRQSVACSRPLDDASGYAEAKLACAKFFFDRMLPRSEAHLMAMLSGGANLMLLDEDAF